MSLQPSYGFDTSSWSHFWFLASENLLLICAPDLPWTSGPMAAGKWEALTALISDPVVVDFIVGHWQRVSSDFSLLISFC
jgi:hypothetical protein